MVGTAGLPHVIVRFFTVKKVSDARKSAGWALLFIAILYTTAPAVAVFSRTNLIETVGNKAYASLPEWFNKWEATGLITYDEFDPSPFSVGEEKPNNLLGVFGANFSSILFFIFGDASWLIIAGFIMLIRIVIITNYKRSHVFLRIIIIFFTSFILSLSFELVSLNSGIFGKALLFKIKCCAHLYNCSK